RSAGQRFPLLCVSFTVVVWVVAIAGLLSVLSVCLGIGIRRVIHAGEECLELGAQLLASGDVLSWFEQRTLLLLKPTDFLVVLLLEGANDGGDLVGVLRLLCELLLYPGDILLERLQRKLAVGKVCKGLQQRVACLRVLRNVDVVGHVGGKSNCIEYCGRLLHFGLDRCNLRLAHPRISCTDST